MGARLHAILAADPLLDPLGDARGRNGGRKKGTPNRTTREVREFFAEVLREAFKDKAFKDRLVKKITSLDIDVKLFMAILNHAAGSPRKQVDHNVHGALRLEQIVAGVVPDEPEDDEGEDDGGGS